MINLKRNKKLELVPAKGIRKRKSSIYTPNQSEQFKVSRGKFNDFLTCPRCFYMDRVKGLASPGMPGWSLNETTDRLLKKEFDICREDQIPHRIFIENNLNHLVPFNHPDMNKWRDSLHHGLMVNYKNLILSGGVDDIWLNTKTDEIIVVDYKSQATSYEVNTRYYLASAYHQGYKVQMDFYAYLLTEMGFDVSDTSYFLVCNADREAEGFYGKLTFSETLIPYKHNIAWIPSKIDDMIDTLNNNQIPLSHDSCENCAYARHRSVYDNI